MLFHELCCAVYPEYDFPKNITVWGLCCDSRHVQKGDVFFALSGTQKNGSDFIDEAIQKGAVAVLQSGDVFYHTTKNNVPVIVLPKLSQHVGEIATHFYGYPTRAMKVIGVTGTNGKTTSAYLLAQMLEKLNNQVALIGTLGVGRLHALQYTGLTTPDAIQLQRYFSKLRDDGVDYVVMEVSSHALEQSRVAGISFYAAWFTNLTPEHLDYHKTMEAYGLAKAKLFQWPTLQYAVLNSDDPFSDTLKTMLPKTAEVMWYGTKQTEHTPCVFSDNVQLSTQGIDLTVNANHQSMNVHTSLLGEFNVSNLLGVMANLYMLGIDLQQSMQLFSTLQPAPGRMQVFQAKGLPTVVIDFAHTADALEKVLQSLRMFHPRKIICLFGCGGNRDATKRPIMGEIAERLADEVVLTSDNPRTESPEDIINAILLGFKEKQHAHICVDREKAIRLAIELGTEHDIVLIAGRGHETYQVVGDQHVPLSDIRITEEIIHAAMAD